MNGILQYLLSTITSLDKNAMNCAAFLSLAFGLTSYIGQVNALENYYQQSKHRMKPGMFDIVQKRLKSMKSYNFRDSPKNPIEIGGVRTGDLFINGMAVGILRELLSDICDGYIAPRLFSPYQEENFIHEEIVIFKPIEFLELYNITKIPEIKSIIFSPSISCKYKNTINTKILKGGSFYEDPNKFFDDIKNINEVKRLAKKFINKHINIKCYKLPLNINYYL